MLSRCVDGNFNGTVTDYSAPRGGVARLSWTDDSGARGARCRLSNATGEQWPCAECRRCRRHTVSKHIEHQQLRLAVTPEAGRCVHRRGRAFLVGCDTRDIADSRLVDLLAEH